MPGAAPASSAANNAVTAAASRSGSGSGSGSGPADGPAEGGAEIRRALQTCALLQLYSRARRDTAAALGARAAGIAEQEVAYNMGRACHQLGLLHIAVQQYEQVAMGHAAGGESAPGRGSGGTDNAAGGAEADDADADREAGLATGVVDTTGDALRRAAAHNLALIYRASGSTALAHHALHLAPAF